MRQLLTTLEANTKAMQDIKAKNEKDGAAPRRKGGGPSAREQGIVPPPASSAGLTATQVATTLAAVGSQATVTEGMEEKEFINHIAEILLKTKSAKHLKTYMGRVRPKIIEHKFRKARAEQLWNHVRGL